MELVQPAQGTCFRIFLPVENPESQAASAAAPEEAAEPGMAGGTGRAGEAVAMPARGAR